MKDITRAMRYNAKRYLFTKANIIIALLIVLLLCSLIAMFFPYNYGQNNTQEITLEQKLDKYAQKIDNLQLQLNDEKYIGEEKKQAIMSEISELQYLIENKLSYEDFYAVTPDSILGVIVPQNGYGFENTQFVMSLVLNILLICFAILFPSFIFLKEYMNGERKNIFMSRISRNNFWLSKTILTASVFCVVWLIATIISLLFFAKIDNTNILISCGASFKQVSAIGVVAVRALGNLIFMFFTCSFVTAIGVAMQKFIAPTVIAIATVSLTLAFGASLGLGAEIGSDSLIASFIPFYNLFIKTLYLQTSTWLVFVAYLLLTILLFCYTIRKFKKQDIV
ncbi:MAG: hypothetical protein RR416_00870 [Clostridia bacterium]